MIKIDDHMKSHNEELDKKFQNLVAKIEPDLENLAKENHVQVELELNDENAPKPAEPVPAAHVE